MPTSINQAAHDNLDPDIRDQLRFALAEVLHNMGINAPAGVVYRKDVELDNPAFAVESSQRKQLARVAAIGVDNDNFLYLATFPNGYDNLFVLRGDGKFAKDWLMSYKLAGGLTNIDQKKRLLKEAMGVA